MKAPHLNRALVLEGVVRSPDGAGGFAETWTTLGTQWAAVLPGSGSDTLGEERMLSAVPYRIMVRGAPVGSEQRPKAGQRFREGTRLFWIQAVTERDPQGRHLTCFCARGGAEMSYGAAPALQTAVFQLLSAPALAGVAIHDAVPPNATGTFVLIGPEDARDQSDKSGAGAEHQMVISVITDAAGFLSIKTIAADISDALVGAPLVLSRGSLVSLFFLRASARRIEEGETRRIDLTFRARVQL